MSREFNRLKSIAANCGYTPEGMAKCIVADNSKKSGGNGPENITDILSAAEVKKSFNNDPEAIADFIAAGKENVMDLLETYIVDDRLFLVLLKLWGASWKERKPFVTKLLKNPKIEYDQKCMKAIYQLLLNEYRPYRNAGRDGDFFETDKFLIKAKRFDFLIMAEREDACISQLKYLDACCLKTKESGGLDPKKYSRYLGGFCQANMAFGLENHILYQYGHVDVLEKNADWFTLAWYDEAKILARHQRWYEMEEHGGEKCETTLKLLKMYTTPAPRGN